jgi:deoxyhypusine synthase
MQREELLKDPIEHIDFKKIDSKYLMEAMGKMSFSSRDLARAADIYVKMLKEKEGTVFLSLAGSTSAAGCMQVYVDLVRHHMIDAVIATGASIVDMDFFEALGFKHYRGTPFVDDNQLRDLHVDRIYDTFIDEDQLKECDTIIAKLADKLEPRPYSSREFIREMGKFLKEGGAKKQESLVQVAYEEGMPIFCPAFSDSSAGFGLVYHQYHNPEKHLSIDSVKDFLELTKIKMSAPTSGLLMVGGGVPKNFIQDTVVAAEVLGKDVPMHKYAVQITVADVRDGACSSSTLKEASSWGKVETNYEQMVYAEATLVLPLIAAHAYHSGAWKERKAQRWADFLDKA